MLDEKFSAGAATPTDVLIRGDDVQRPDVQEAIEHLQIDIENDADLVLLGAPQFDPGGSWAIVSVAVPGESASDEAIDAFKQLKDRHVPHAFAGVIGVEILIGGDTPQASDFFDIIGIMTPAVMLFVLTFSFVLLLLVFRSLVVPIKAIIMNLLSVGAAYGVLVAIFQLGWGADQLGFDTVEKIEVWLPIFLFTILFGLSMDYHVFLLSRIRERFDETHDNRASVRYGLRSTANIITGAAAIMVVVFGGFALGDLVMFQQMGVGLAVAIFLDATLVRTLLVPSTMRLLGDTNWYLPSWLEWLPDLRVERAALAPEPLPGPAGSTAGGGGGDGSG